MISLDASTFHSLVKRVKVLSKLKLHTLSKLFFETWSYLNSVVISDLKHELLDFGSELFIIQMRHEVDKVSREYIVTMIENQEMNILLLNEQLLDLSSNDTADKTNCLVLCLELVVLGKLFFVNFNSKSWDLLVKFSVAQFFHGTVQNAKVWWLVAELWFKDRLLDEISNDTLWKFLIVVQLVLELSRKWNNHLETLCTYKRSIFLVRLCRLLFDRCLIFDRFCLHDNLLLLGKFFVGIFPERLAGVVIDEVFLALLSTLLFFSHFKYYNYNVIWEGGTSYFNYIIFVQMSMIKDIQTMLKLSWFHTCRSLEQGPS